MTAPIVDASGGSDPDEDSAGYERLAAEFIARRDRASIGASVIREWAASLPVGAEVLELGCGHGVPTTQALIDAGLRVHAVDAAPALVAAFRDRFPEVSVECARVQDLALVQDSFDAVLVWGLLFLLSEPDQEGLLRAVGRAVRPGGSFLFTAPEPIGTWSDALTGRPSVSLGATRYRSLLGEAGFAVEREGDDEGGNRFCVARRT